jgi:hypothetical protein
MNERISKFGIPVATMALSFGAGVCLGYILGRRKKYVPTHIVPAVKKDFTDVEKEIEHTLEYYDQEEAKGRSPAVISNSEVEKFVAEKLQEASTNNEEPTEDEDHTIIFAGDTPEWDYVSELAKRVEDIPYILHKDEFYADERGYTQTTLTYYSGDDIMVDEEDSPVYNHTTVVGELFFGHGSGDPNVVYVRNAERKAEYEILFDPGLYSIEVLGLEIEPNARVKSLKNGPPRFRKNE